MGRCPIFFAQQSLTPSDCGSYCQYKVDYVAHWCHLSSCFDKPKDDLCDTKFIDDAIVKGVKWWKNIAGIFPVLI
jgi:hypothetical protein